MKSPFMRVRDAPILLAALIIADWVCALVGDGILDLAFAVALFIPMLPGAWYGLRRRA